MFEVLFHIDFYEYFDTMLYSTYSIRGYYEYAMNKTGDELPSLNVYIPHFRPNNQDKCYGIKEKENHK